MSWYYTIHPHEHRHTYIDVGLASIPGCYLYAYVCQLAVVVCIGGRNDVMICIPGAGLGRLAFDLARLGYAAQGNEWSAYMLMAANLILNKYHSTLIFR